MNHEDVLALLAAYRDRDAPTHGGRVLSYVYDSGRPELDELAAAAAKLMQPVNGLDPTTFPSVARLEGDLIGFAREMLHGPHATGSVTSGGTESCLLAVKAARDAWRLNSPADAYAHPRLVLPTSAHAAFHKAAHYLELQTVTVPVDPVTGIPESADLIAAIDADAAATALVVVSAPSYPHGMIDPIEPLAAAAQDRGVPCHVDACIGGLVLPWWEAAGGGPVPVWDFAVPGVSSISADLHKYGYAPKGASLLLFAEPELDRARYFSFTDWPGYPVVNPTILGSRAATSLGAAWAVMRTLGRDGYVELARRTVRATAGVRAVVERIEGLRVLGEPTGPLLAVVVDDRVPTEHRVDPHAWCAACLEHGFVLQGQPGLAQPDGREIPRSAHLTVTPVTEDLLGELSVALPAAADRVRGRRGLDLSDLDPALVPDPAELARGARGGGGLDLTSVLALVEALPREYSANLLTRFLAEFTAP